MKEKFQAINFPNGIEFNNKLFQSIGVDLENVENVDIDAKAYLIEQLGIEDNQLRDDSKNLIQRNFIHLICQVRNDLSTIEERLKKYKKERADLDGVKSNEAEYRRRKLEYFTKMNKSAQNDIVLFLTKGITGYLKEIQYDTLQRECAKDDCGKIFKNRRYLFAQFPEYYDADFDYSTVVKMSQLPGINLIDVPKIEKKYLEMHRNNPEKYYCEIKKIINVKKVQSAQVESQTVEVKRSKTKATEKLFDTLSSFSNQDDGGVIIFGLYENENFTVTGVDDVQALQKSVMEQCEQMEPTVRAVFTVTEIYGKNVVSAEIPPIDITERPCYYKGKGRLKGSYVRVGDSDQHMSEYEVYSYEAYRKKYQDDIRKVNAHVR